jgi:tRNA/tmRNA/rRNA uracil-C5-methylase (TrmA/RlmC/RlmD family)
VDTSPISAAAGRPAEAGRTGLVELAVSDVAHGGWCVARQPGGRVVFVRHALPGERVLARITGTTSRFARAEAVEILQASPDRIAPPCPHARPDGCGGCDWQHASLEAQRELKAEVVRQQLRRIAGLDRQVTVEPLPGDSGGLGWPGSGSLSARTVPSACSNTGPTRLSTSVPARSRIRWYTRQR